MREQQIFSNLQHSFHLYSLYLVDFDQWSIKFDKLCQIQCAQQRKEGNGILGDEKGKPEKDFSFEDSQSTYFVDMAAFTRLRYKGQTKQSNCKCLGLTEVK